MGMEVEEWVPPTRSIKAVFLTNSNIEEVAKWVGADFTHVMTDLRTRERTVEFFKDVETDPDRPSRARDPRRPGDRIVVANVGQYILREDSHIDRYGDKVNDRYYGLDEEVMQNFRREQKKD